jgi:DNA-binding winged helix-turn-helix (wHTH) protein
VIYRFGPCELDTTRFELRRAGTPQMLEPQVFKLLLHLIENRTRVVTRDELNDTVWKGRTVSESALNSCIKSARHAIGDDGQAQTHIRTIHRIGYRFVGDIDHLPRAAPPNFAASANIAEIVATAAPSDDLDLTLPNQP